MRNIKIVPIIPELRTIKPSGADIAEAIEYGYTADDLYNHIVGKRESDPDSLDDFFKRRCLGVADDKNAYFIDLSGRLESCRLKSLSKNLLMSFADYDIWRADYPGKKEGISWDEAINDIIRISMKRDFDPESTLGRGAWRRKDGEICYHNGLETIGKKDPTKIYLRKMKKDIGITEKPIDIETCQAIGRIALDMTFETKLDAVRCLAWSCLAPFAGALPWRPAILLTGGSGTGKSKVIEHLVTPIAAPQFFNGAETTPAYLRAKIAADSCGVVFDETEGGDRAKENRRELFLVMRQSTSDNSPVVGKSNKDQGYIDYKMKNMFMFASIHAGVDDEADEKRILRVNLKKKPDSESKWKNQRNELLRLCTEENCRRIRSLTWSKLGDIIKLSEEIDEIISEVTGMDLRSSFAEALIISCYFIIWRGMSREESLSDVGYAMIADIYKLHEIEERNEPAETLNKLLDSIIFLPEKHENRTLREMLFKVKSVDTDTEKKEYVETLDRYGLKYISDKDGEQIAIQKDNGMIRKLLETGNGYNKIFWRHKDCVSKSRRVRMAGSPRTCVMIKGVFDVGECDVEDIAI